ncbi:Rtt106 domain-containing protein [Mycena venus]|uniref:Rtt106 domain-containing protein n=1 Tax=Mycena venus TaxID=2733690 RepID=A0A8H6XEN0_9AGAR|nr:Rtt106 domain-containing protein [Mycena venus]
MAPTSHFFAYFPLVIDSLTYGVYFPLFFQSVHILLSRRRHNYKFYLICMITLFLLSSLHIALAWAWAFITDTADTAIYEVISLNDPPPELYGPDDSYSLHRVATLIKVRFLMANTIADTIIIYRCYVIWAYNWRVIAFPAFGYGCTLIASVVVALPLSQAAKQPAVAVIVAATFATNVSAASLAAGRIWWISHRTALFIGRTSRRKFDNLTAIILESGLIYPASLIVNIAVRFLSPATFPFLTCIAGAYHIVAIAPTLIIVRVGLGVSTDDVEKSVAMSRGLLFAPGMRETDDTTMELGVRPQAVTFTIPHRNDKHREVQRETTASITENELKHQ